MPLLFRTVCSTDWKARPSHSLVYLGRGTEMQLEHLINEDVRRTMAEDLAADEYNERSEQGEELADGWDALRAEQLLQSDVDLKELWENNCRYEMQHDEPRIGREFVLLHDDGYRSTMVYHVEKDDFTV